MTETSRNIILNEQQLQGVQMAKWLKKKPRRIGVLAGPAGTGKTTSLKAICDELGEVILLSPTNRAALKAKQLSGREATTIHQYLYHPELDKETGELRFKRRLDLAKPKSGVIIIDECSLLNFEITKDLWDVLNEIDVSFLFVGDWFQLLPVQGDWSVFSGDFKEFVEGRGSEFQRVDLIKVMRQALESPILRAATDIRKKPLDWSFITKDVISRECFKQYGDVPKRLSKWLAADVDHACIVYTHRIRHKINRAVRELQGYGPDMEPQPGELLLVRKNEHKAGVSNGEVIKFNGFVDGPVKPPKWGRFTMVNDKLCLVSPQGIMFDRHPASENLRGLQHPYIECNFGAAITCHAAQGSEYENVILNWEEAINDGPMGLMERARFVYTAMTRARDTFGIGWAE